MKRIIFVFLLFFVWGCHLETRKQEETTSESEKKSTEIKDTITVKNQETIVTKDPTVILERETDETFDPPPPPTVENPHPQPVLKSRKTKESEKKIGGTVAKSDTATSTASSDTKTDASKDKETSKKKIEETTDVGFGFWTKVLIASGFFLALVIGGFVLWKLKPPWLSFLWKLLKRS